MPVAAIHLARLWGAREGIAASTSIYWETNWACKDPLLGAPRGLKPEGWGVLGLRGHIVVAGLRFITVRFYTELWGAAWSLPLGSVSCIFCHLMTGSGV